MLFRLQRAFRNKDVSWSKLSHYWRVAYRMCHDEVNQAPTSSTRCHEDVNQALTSSARAVGRLPDEQYSMFLMKPDQPAKPKVLRVSIIGEPNSGKSTLVNRLMGWRVNAVSSKVHTTRKNTAGILTEGNTQVVFMDTPGVITAYQRKRHHCEPNMLTDPEQSVSEMDVVGVVVDVANKWTRTALNKEVLKILHLHPDTKTFLVLNKVDALKKRDILLETARKLTSGVVAGHEMTFPDRVRGQKKETMINMNDKYFNKLEDKYGKMKHKKKTSSGMFWQAYQQKMADINAESSDSEETLEELGIDDRESETHIDSKDNKVETDALHQSDKVDTDKVDLKHEHNVDLEHEPDDTEHDVDDGFAELEQTYQSDFLARLRANAAPPSENKQQPEEKLPDFSWTERMERIKEACKATGWARFDRVFMVSALEGDGVNDIKRYLFDIAKPGDWEYNSCLVTSQHPHDIAKMCVWQCLLDNVPNWLPYSAVPEIVYWSVDQYDRLDIVVEVVVDCQLTRFVGLEGSNVKKISDQARQALLDAFQCEVSFKLMFRQRSRRVQNK